MQDKTPHRSRLSELESWYSRYYSRLVMWADTIVHDIAVAEDIVQDLFIYLWEKELYDGFSETDAKSYLYVAVKNKALRHVKQERRNVKIPELSIIEKAWEDGDSSHEELSVIIKEELDKLSPRSRTVLEYIHLKNMKYKDVAEELGISVSTVKTLLVRSIKTLRKRIDRDTFLNLLLFKVSSPSQISNNSTH